MMRKKQVGHVIVERQILSALSSAHQMKGKDQNEQQQRKQQKQCPFIVHLFWAFQASGAL